MAGTSSFQVSSECKAQRLPSIRRGPAPGKRCATAGLGTLRMGRAGGRLLTRVCRTHFLKPEVGTAESCWSGNLRLVSTEGGASSRAGLLGEFTGGKSRVPGERERARERASKGDRDSVCVSVCV